MGNSEEQRGSAFLAAPPRDSHAIRRLALSTCVLVVAAVGTLLIMHYPRRNEDKHLIRASQLAEEGLDEVLRRADTFGVANLPIPGEEPIVSEESGERFVRRVEISPDERVGSRRVTVTVVWGSFANGSRVSVHGWLNEAGTGRAEGPGAASPVQIREALSP